VAVSTTQSNEAMTRTRAIGITSSVLLIFGLVLVSSFNFWDTKKPPPPHELFGTRVEPYIVTPDANGELNITLHTTSIRREGCYAQLYRTFANSDTNEIVYQTVMIGGRVPQVGSPVEFPFKMKLPPARFPPGNYAYTAYAIDRCAEDKVYVVATTMTFFKVSAP
jgi:hypothetical protein